jgi:hypothetical protein
MRLHGRLLRRAALEDRAEQIGPVVAPSRCTQTPHTHSGRRRRSGRRPLPYRRARSPPRRIDLAHHAAPDRDPLQARAGLLTRASSRAADPGRSGARVEDRHLAVAIIDLRCWRLRLLKARRLYHLAPVSWRSRLETLRIWTVRPVSGNVKSYRFRGAACARFSGPWSVPPRGKASSDCARHDRSEAQSIWG